MKLSLQLKIGQQLTMTPQLQQAIKLLQLSTLDLRQEIHQAIESNPMLEFIEDSVEEDSSHEETEIAPLDQSDRNESLGNSQENLPDIEDNTW